MFDPFESLNIRVYATAPTVICGLQVLSGLIWNMRCEQTTRCRRTEVGRLDFALNSKDQQIQMGLFIISIVTDRSSSSSVFPLFGFPIQMQNHSKHAN